jgi:hypothetical protein
MKFFTSYSMEESSHVTWWSPALLAVVVWQGDSLLVGQAPHNARARARPAVGGAAAPRACVPARTRPRLTLFPFRMMYSTTSTSYKEIITLKGLCHEMNIFFCTKRR